MLKHKVNIGILVLVIMGFAQAGFAQNAIGDHRFDVKASIPEQNGFNISISRIQGNTWTAQQNVDFGTLRFNDEFDIFESDYYYAVEVGVTANLLNWSLKHTRTPVVRAGGQETLNDNINVTFMKQMSKVLAQELEQVTYEDSNNKNFTKAQLLGGWLRVYYGIATGGNEDAPGAEPVTLEKAAGNYLGEVTITLFETL